MKKAIIFTLTFSMIGQSLAALTCLQDSSYSELNTCFASDNNFEIASCEVLQDEQESLTPQELEEILPKDELPPLCNRSQLLAGEKISAKERRAKEKQLKRQCRKKARTYKRAVMKSLMNDMKVGQAAQALFKRKSKIAKSRRSRTTISNVDLELTKEDLEALESMGKQEFSKMMMNKLKEKFPSLDEVINQQKNQSQAFTGAIDQKESIPLNILITAGGRETCQLVSESDWPLIDEEFEPESCELCKTEEFQDNFTNDCSYMVNDNFKESTARELVGASRKKGNTGHDSHCNNSMQGVNNDMTQIDETANKICNIAKDGEIPKFSIETSRNLYNDHTPDLAQKRGEFTQKYLYEKVKKDCDLDEVPLWLKDLNSFSEKITISYPDYKRPNNTPGNYGPDPNAKKEDQEKELEYLKNTLSAEMESLKAEKTKYEKKINELKDKIKKNQNQNKKLRSSYRTQKKSINNSDLRELAEKRSKLVETLNEGESTVTLDQEYKQELHNLETKVKSINELLNSPKYSKQNNQFKKVMDLEQFYNERDSKDFDRFKWDKELFDDFKMARIKGDIEKESPYLGIPEELLTDELKIALESVIRINSYTCELTPIETKKPTLEGMLKLPLKVATIATVPFIAAGAIAATVAASPITTGISIFCEDCREPGRVPPILRFGNLFHLDLSKRSRREFNSELKTRLSNYVTWGGALKVKGDHHINEHSLIDYAKKLGQKPYAEMDEKEKENLLEKLLTEIENYENRKVSNGGEKKSCYNSENSKKIKGLHYLNNQQKPKASKQ